EKAGIDVAPVKQAPMSEWVSANGEISYDQTRVASLSAPVPGKVWRVEKELGQPVAKGEVLALVEAAEVGKAKEEFLKALAEVDLQSKNVEAVESLSSRGGARDVEVRQTQTALRVAQIRLGAAEQALVNLGLPIRSADVGKLKPQELAQRVQFLGLAESIPQALDPKTITANLLPVRAPLDGVVVSRKPAVVGEIVDASKTLFVIADTRLMWLTLHVRFEDANSLKVGQAVRFRPDGGGEEAAGKVSWISTAADEKTRTVEVRALLPNSAGRLRANTFGAGRIILREEPKATVVPSEAVQREGEAD